jgi:UDP-N-acetyl-D-glucosamine dehydrogenase
LLQNKIQNRTAKIGILGLGYVGLPLACEFAKAGFPVTGFEVDDRKVTALTKGQSYIEDIPEQELRPLVHNKMLTATTDFSQLRKMDVTIICVPTPLRKTKDPDISFIAESTKAIAQHLHPQQLVVLESTTYPGTTKEFVMPMLEATGHKVGKDIYLAFSPERIDPGNRQFRLANTPKVVGGITATCGDLAAQVYGAIVARASGAGVLDRKRGDGQAFGEHFPRRQHRPRQRSGFDLRQTQAERLGSHRSGLI